jgi:hypothetical protein
LWEQDIILREQNNIASHEDVLDLQVKVLKGQLEEQKLNKLKLELQIDILKK